MARARLRTRQMPRTCVGRWIVTIILPPGTCSDGAGPAAPGQRTTSEDAFFFPEPGLGTGQLVKLPSHARQAFEYLGIAPRRSGKGCPLRFPLRLGFSAGNVSPSGHLSRIPCIERGIAKLDSSARSTAARKAQPVKTAPWSRLRQSICLVSSSACSDQDNSGPSQAQPQARASPGFPKSPLGLRRRVVNGPAAW